VGQIAVVVVSYNTRDALRRCLGTLGEADVVVVVDNDSTDGSPEMVAADFPAVTLIRNDRNVGFGAANNQALAALTTDLVLLLNSDAWAEPGAISRLADVFADSSVAAAGGRLVYPDGRTQNSTARALTWTKLIGEQLMLDKVLLGITPFGNYWTTGAILKAHTPGGIYDVAQLMGACLMMRRGERFDARYPLYCEDTELCDRLRTHGRLVYVPDAPFGHALGSSTSADRWRGVALYNAGKERYFGDRYGTAGRLLAWLIDRMGAGLRLIAWLGLNLVSLGLRARWRGQVGLFWRVLTAPVDGPPLRQRSG